VAGETGSYRYADARPEAITHKITELFRQVMGMHIDDHF